MRNGFMELVLGVGEAGAGGEEAADEDASTGMAAAPKVDVHAVDIDWPELYPFADGGTPRQKVAEESETVSASGNAYERMVGAVKSRAEIYVNDYLFGRQAMLELGSAFVGLARWNYVSYDEYNGIVETDDGYLTTVYPRVDVRDEVAAVAGLAERCDALGASFLYVCAPFKVCEHDDPVLSGGLDFSNQNADDLLSSLVARGVGVCDLRAAIHEEGLPHHGMFYRTDHHWLPSSGLWAARRLAALLNDRYGCGLDLAAIEPEGFDAVVYPQWFLGSQGKKVTLSRAEPEDFELYYPKFETSLHYRVPSLGIDSVATSRSCTTRDGWRRETTMARFRTRRTSTATSRWR